MRPADESPTFVSQRRLLLGGLAIVALLAFVLAGKLFFPAEPAAQRPSSIVAGNNEPKTPEPTVPSTAQSRAKTAAEPLVVPSTFLPSDYAVATVVVSADNLMALTREDKTWLAKHGYPTLAEVEWSKQASLDELKAATRGGIRFAALYGERLWEQDHYREGKAVLTAALAQGSLYAAEAIALRVLRDGEKGSDINNAASEAAAWWFYASQMGNYRASSAVTDSINGLGVDYLGPAMLRSFGIAQEIDAIRAARGLPPVLRDPRPSFDAYLESRYQRETTVIPR